MDGKVRNTQGDSKILSHNFGIGMGKRDILSTDLLGKINR